MKRVSSTEIIGNPNAVGTIQHPCHGNQIGTLFADGSIMSNDGALYAPERHDDELYEMRQQFDRENRVTNLDRLLSRNQERMYCARYGLIAC